MSRAKRDAIAAMKEMANYLRRDLDGTKLLEVIKRYVGELRQTTSGLRTEVTHLTGNLERSRAHAEILESELQLAGIDLEKSKAAVRQKDEELRSICALAQNLTDVVNCNSDEFVPDESHEIKRTYLQGIKGGMSQLLKLLYALVPMPPRFMDEESHPVLFLEDVVTGFSEDEYIKLGVLVMASAMIGMPVAFRCEAVTDQSSRIEGGWITEPDVKRFRKWAERRKDADKEPALNLELVPGNEEARTQWERTFLDKKEVRERQNAASMLRELRGEELREKKREEENV